MIAHCSQGDQVNNVSNRKKVYYFDSVPDNFMNNDLFKNTLHTLIQRMERCESNQEMLNSIYEDLCQTLLQQMDNHLQFKDCSKKTKKSFKISKPYWNETLYNLWKDMRNAEKLYLKSKGSRRHKQVVRQKFKDKRTLFDKMLRQTQRAYYKNFAENLESEINTKDPKSFWNHIRKLGPKQKYDIPLKICNNDGTYNFNVSAVCSHWENEFSQLLNKPPDSNSQESNFQNNVKQTLLTKEQEMEAAGFTSNHRLNSDISMNEIAKAVKNLKRGKAGGPDCIPNEVLAHVNVQSLILKLFQFCFDKSLIPSLWTKAAITPIPKGSTKDPCVPLNYRGISLLCCFSKLYSSVLNNRLVDEADEKNWLVEEQNGFRKKRSCLDHLFVISSVLRNKIGMGKSVFASFIDLQKAFDWVDRKLLLYKLNEFYKIDGKMYWAIKSLLKNSQSCIRLNNSLCTNWFNVTSGVRQGDSLSPFLFSLFINDLATELKTLDCGVSLNENNKISILLYADDIVIMSESEGDLQKMLDNLSVWCNKWSLNVNLSKSNIIHFRKRNITQTMTQFMLGSETLSFVDEYKYLGLYLNEHMDFSKTASHLAYAGSRALGALRNKIYSLKDVGFRTYSKLYHSGVTPILDYCSGIWGYNNFKCIDDVQNRALRYFMGVHKFCPLPALEGDMGWRSSSVRRYTEIISLWNRILGMEDTRLPKIALRYNIELRNQVTNWVVEFQDICRQLNYENAIADQVKLEGRTVNVHLYDKQLLSWNNARHQKPKLRYYNLFKAEIETENYITANI